MSAAPAELAPPEVAQAYREGRRRFLGLELLVAPGALVPREETEVLGRTAVRLLQDREVRSTAVIDMCCGAGNLACAIAHHVPGCQVFAADLTQECVELAQRNVARLGLDGQVAVYRGDLFAPLAEAGVGEVDMIVCNPPYISTGRLQGDRQHLLAHEPKEAFDGGPYGIAIHQRVIREGLPFLRPRGFLLFEIGQGQERQVKALFSRSRTYGEVDSISDSAGEVRVVLARKL